MVKTLIFPGILLLLLSGFISEGQSSEEKMMQYFFEGNFSEAEQLIKEMIKSNPDKNTEKELEIIRAKMYRNKNDFSKTEADIKNELLPYFPDLSDEKLRAWEKANKLEMRLINGKRRYFRNAVPNLFRVDKKAAEVKERKDGKTVDPLKKICLEHTSKLIKKVENGKSLEDEIYITGIDGYRLIINDDFSSGFNPPKDYFRSEPIDFQRGELEWSGGNIYFDKWNYKMDVKYLKTGK